MPCVTPLRLAVALPDDALVAEAEGGKLDLVSVSGQVPDAGTTSRIGLLTELDGDPADVAAVIATLDQASTGRAGWLAPIGTSAGVVEAVHRAWDASPTPTRPLIAVQDLSTAIRFADLLLVSPPASDEDVRVLVADVRAAREDPAPLKIFADLTVALDADPETATLRIGTSYGKTVFAGTPVQLYRRLQIWQRLGIEGFHLRLTDPGHDLRQITRVLVPDLQENDAFRRGYETRTLRSLLGLPVTVRS